MFYYLYFLKEKISFFNIFQYITFRSCGAFLTGFIFVVLVSYPIIKKIKSLKALQQIRDDGPKTHLKKIGTPTMGGVIVLIGTIVSAFLWVETKNRFFILLVLSSIYFGIVGFIDDYLKFSLKNTKGLSFKKKLFFQFLGAFLISLYLYFNPVNSNYFSSIDVPFTKNVFIDLGIFYFIFVAFVVVGSSNAVNLTDGLDGLAIGLVILTFVTFIILSYLTGHYKFSIYLGIIPVLGSGEITVFLSGVVGASLGFLWYNFYPADIFMGDTGSIFLGGIIGTVAVIIKQELLLLISGGVFVIEAISVMLQVFSYKYFNQKRIFKMAPIHHHFELLGWKETKVVIRFWIIGVLLMFLSLSSLKIR